MINSSDTEKINFIISTIENDEDIIGLIRFGSSVESKNHRDIDLCIIAKSREISLDKKLKYKLLLPDKYDVHFFFDLPVYVRQEVIKKGKIEFMKDIDLFYDIVYDFFKEWQLFEPHFKTYLELIKNG